MQTLHKLPTQLPEAMSTVSIGAISILDIQVAETDALNRTSCHSRFIVYGTIEFLMNVGKMLTLQLKRAVITAKDTAEQAPALMVAPGRCDVSHTRLQVLECLGERTADGVTVFGTATYVIAWVVGIDNHEFIHAAFVDEIGMLLSND